MKFLTSIGACWQFDRYSHKLKIKVNCIFITSSMSKSLITIEFGFNPSMSVT